MLWVCIGLTIIDLSLGAPQLDVIRNPRNLDTEDLTSETNDDWMGQTANLCCVNMYDTVCNQPCN
jgi:hypothetical protein